MEHALNTFEVTYGNDLLTARVGVRQLRAEFGKAADMIIGARASNIPATVTIKGSLGVAKVSYLPMSLEPEMLVLYSFYFDARRMGSLEGVFVATESEVAAAMDKAVHFGEALGKHSEVSFDLQDEQLTVMSTDQVFIKQLVSIMTSSVSGYNPIERIREQEEEMESDGE